MAGDGAQRPGNAQIAAMRLSYEGAELLERDLAPDWPTQFGRWLAAAVDSGLFPEPNAMVLATASPEARPSARTVLLKGYDARGFVFYTNYHSRKSRELAANPVGALVFPWVALRRQVVVSGAVERVSAAETAAYFASRPRGSQLAAWASPQSEVVASRAVLDEAFARVSARWPEPGPVPVPEHWGGLRVVPEAVEFWQGHPDRLHDRLRYRRISDAHWAIERLAP